MNALLLSLWCLVLVYSVKSQCLTENDRQYLNDQSIQPVQTAMNTLYNGEQHFSLEMFQRLNSVRKTRNIFFSPYSVHSALLLAYFGARSKTEAELSAVLGLKNVDKINAMRAYKTFKKLLDMRSRINPSKKYKFNVANRLYFDVRENIRDCMHNLFLEEIAKVDFVNNADQARLQINNWVEQQTRTKIKNLLPPGYLDSSTNLALVNAAYFKGQWSSQFKPDKTRDALFYISASEFAIVKMMEQKGSFRYGVSDRLQAHILEMPYVGNDMSMFILLPPYVHGAIETTIRNLNVSSLKEAMEYMHETQVEVSLPKFKVEQAVELPQILQDMGIQDLFNPHSADLSAFSGVPDKFIGKVRHKAFIEINEEGSEAAAATVLVGFRNARPVEIIKFECNHPFIYFIFDKFSNTILFMGVYRNPKLLS